MKINALVLAASTAFLVFGSAAQATDRPSHFKGEAAPSWAAAQANLIEYNQKLANIMAKDTLSPQDLGEIHQLTYTLENALQRMEKDIEDLAETLEKVHVASETGKADLAKKEGDIYLKAAKVLLPQ